VVCAFHGGCTTPAISTSRAYLTGWVVVDHLNPLFRYTLEAIRHRSSAYLSSSRTSTKRSSERLRVHNNHEHPRPTPRPYPTLENSAIPPWRECYSSSIKISSEGDPRDLIPQNFTASYQFVCGTLSKAHLVYNEADNSRIVRTRLQADTRNPLNL